jgi:hypothetical protein
MLWSVNSFTICLKKGTVNINNKGTVCDKNIPYVFLYLCVTVAHGG